MIHAKIILTVTEPHQMIVVGDNGTRNNQCKCKLGRCWSQNAWPGGSNLRGGSAQATQVGCKVLHRIETESDSAMPSGVFTSTNCLYILNFENMVEGEIRRGFPTSQNSL